MKREEIGVSYIATLFGVSHSTIKKWHTLFAEFLSSSANPMKGQPRIYTAADIRVFAVIMESRDWETIDDYDTFPDIYSALNSGEQYSQSHLKFSYFNTSLFQDIPPDMDERWKHGILLGGFTPRSGLDFAHAYKQAGDILIEYALASEEPYELTYPIFYNYRHAIELYLKVIVNPVKYNHDLSKLIKQLKEKHQDQLPSWFERFLEEFHAFDRLSTTFRYGDSLPDIELWIDLNQLRAIMNALFEQLEQILATDGYTRC